MERTVVNHHHKPVAVVIGATSKWQSDGSNTQLIHGGDVSDDALSPSIRWGSAELWHRSSPQRVFSLF